MNRWVGRGDLVVPGNGVLTRQEVLNNELIVYDDDNTAGGSSNKQNYEDTPMFTFDGFYKCFVYL